MIISRVTNYFSVWFSYLTSLGKNWQTGFPKLPFRAFRRKTKNMHFDQAGVENSHFTAGIEKITKRAFIGLANRRFRPLSHLSVAELV
jgi:hypothetical protein